MLLRNISQLKNERRNESKLLYNVTQTNTMQRSTLLRHLSSLVDLVPNPSISAISVAKEKTSQMNKMITIRALMASNAHLGHNVGLMNQYMVPYIYGHRNGIHIINLEHTLVALKRACAVAREIARNNGNIVFVAQNLQLHRIVAAAAMDAGVFFVTNWQGGTLTNASSVLRRSIKSEGQEQYNEQHHKPDLLVILDLPKSLWAAREAAQTLVPVIAICDTDCNPRSVAYPIPANDDSKSSVSLIANTIAQAVKEGKEMRQ
jgi:small subunit ribosomal protein S2